MPTHTTEPHLPARYYRRLPGILGALGVAPARLLDAAGLDAADIAGEARLSLTQVEALCAAATRLSGRDDLGWQIGLGISPQDHAIVGQALLRSGSLDGALRMAQRYFGLLHPGFRLRYALAGDFGRITLLPWLPFSEVALRIHLEAILVALVAELHALHGAPLGPLSARIGLARPSHGARYRALLGGPVQFDRRGPAGLEVELPATTLCAPRRVGRDPAGSETLRLCERALLRQRPPGQLAEWVRMMLREAERELPDLPALAALLAMSPRSLGRRLEAEGCGFRTLLESVRMQRARQLLADGHDSVERIAERLGYRDPANFRRAFRRVHGHPPGRLRRPN